MKRAALRLWRRWSWWWRCRLFGAPKDARTGRAVGDHGTGSDAIRFALEMTDSGEALPFLEEWECGMAWEEWPEFYTWLERREAGL